MYKIVNDGYIVALGTTGTPLADGELERIKSAIERKPMAADGIDYRLKDESLEWEAFEIPVFHAPDPAEEEISAEEALGIILGGTSYER